MKKSGLSLIVLAIVSVSARHAYSDNMLLYRLDLSDGVSVTADIFGQIRDDDGHPVKWENHLGENDYEGVSMQGANDSIDLYYGTAYATVSTSVGASIFCNPGYTTPTPGLSVDASSPYLGFATSGMMSSVSGSTTATADATFRLQPYEPDNSITQGVMNASMTVSCSSGGGVSNSSSCSAAVGLSYVQCTPGGGCYGFLADTDGIGTVISSPESLGGTFYANQIVNVNSNIATSADIAYSFSRMTTSLPYSEYPEFAASVSFSVLPYTP